MTNEMPKEAGEWWVWRLKGDGAKRVHIGMTRESTNSFSRGLLAESNDYLIAEKHFPEYHWHRIELPEGWKV